MLPHDTYGRDWGLFIGEKLPYILGSNLAGTVVKTGEGVSGFQTGDSIFGLSSLFSPTPDQAGLQEYAILDTDAVAKTPAGFTHDQVATLPVNIGTSWIALFGETGIGFPAPFSNEAKTFDYKSQTLVVLGAGASNGKFAVQFAALAGIGKIIAIAGPGSKDELLAMGATHFVDRHLSVEDLAKEVHSITGADGVTHMYHCHGHDYILDAALLPANKPSSLQSVHPIVEPEARGEGAKLTSARPLCKAVFVEASNEGLAPYKEQFWAQVPKWLEEGKLRPGKYRVIEGLEEVEEINRTLDGYHEGMGTQAVVHP